MAIATLVWSTAKKRRSRVSDDIAAMTMEAPGGARAAPVGDHRAPQKDDAESQGGEGHAQHEA